MKVTEKVIAMAVQFVTILLCIVIGAIVAFIQEAGWVLVPTTFALTLNAYVLVHAGIPLWEWLQDQNDNDDD